MRRLLHGLQNSSPRHRKLLPTKHRSPPLPQPQHPPPTFCLREPGASEWGLVGFVPSHLAGVTPGPSALQRGPDSCLSVAEARPTVQCALWVTVPPALFMPDSYMKAFPFASFSCPRCLPGELGAGGSPQPAGPLSCGAVPCSAGPGAVSLASTCDCRTSLPLAMGSPDTTTCPLGGRAARTRDLLVQPDSQGWHGPRPRAGLGPWGAEL